MNFKATDKTKGGLKYTSTHFFDIYCKVNYYIFLFLRFFFPSPIAILFFLIPAWKETIPFLSSHVKSYERDLGLFKVTLPPKPGPYLFPNADLIEQAMIWKYETRKCIHFAISNFLFPYMPTHLRCLLSPFSHPKNQQYNCLGCLGINLLISTICTGDTDLFSHWVCFMVWARRASSSSPFRSKALA